MAAPAGTKAWVLQDWAVNPESKSRVVLAWFRLAQRCRRGESPLPRVLEKVVDRSYREVTMWFLGAELHPDVEAGPRLRVFHLHGVVLNPSARLGADCTLRAGVVLGNRTEADGTDSRAPHLGDRVDVGAGALLIGPLTLGDDVRVGAGAVVVKDAPSGSTLVGNPARPIQAR